MANLIFPCKSCGVWHDASVPCRVSQQLLASTRDEAGGPAQPAPEETDRPQPGLTLADLVQQADEMEAAALRQFHLLRDVGQALED